MYKRQALQLAKAAADRDSYAAACLLAAYEKDKADVYKRQVLRPARLQ